MDDPQDLVNRKSEHIRINLEKDVQSGLTSGLQNLHFINQALPDFNLGDVDTTQRLFGKTLSAPLLISSMTGGTAEAKRINHNLALAAQQHKIAMGLGSLRAALEDPGTIDTFQVRKAAPDILLFANLGAVQLNYGYTPEHCKRAVEISGADALILHLNALQEALQPEGDTRFSNLLEKIEEVCKTLTVPVIVKEVGWGISGETARMLSAAGVAAVDVAGAGGTSWSQVEMYRMKDPRRAAIANAFRDWGIPTVDSIRQVSQAAPEVLIFGSGGIRDGVDALKVIALGATLAGMAGPFLKAASQSSEAAANLAEDLITEMRIGMFACGAVNLTALRNTPLVNY